MVVVRFVLLLLFGVRCCLCGDLFGLRLLSFGLFLSVVAFSMFVLYGATCLTCVCLRLRCLYLLWSCVSFCLRW